MRNSAAVAYYAYNKAMGFGVRKNPARGRSKPKGARMWDELPDDEKRAWWAAINTRTLTEDEEDVL